MRIIQVKLAGKLYKIKQLPIAKNEAWRSKLFEGPLQEITSQLVNIGQLDVDNPSSLVPMINTIKEVLSTAPLVLLDLISAYCPEVEIDREKIYEEGFDEELVEAAVAVIKLAFPLEQLTALLPKRQNGQVKQGTSKNLPGPSGELLTKTKPLMDISENTQ